MTDKPTPTTDLLKRCAEIYEWRCTGVLSGEALRDYAKRKWPDLHDTLQMAEHETVTEALALLAKWGTPQQEAQEPVAYVHVPHSTVEGKVRPVVSFEKYQQDYADGIYSTRIPLYTAPQPAPAPLSECLSLLNSFEYEGDEDSQAKAFFKAHINEDWFFHVKNSLELALAAQGGKV